jgi:peroxiredoxin
MTKLKTGQGIGQRIWLLGAIGCLAFGVIIGWQPLNGWLERRSAHESEPATAAAIAYLKKMWRNNHTLYSRKAALRYMLRELPDNPALFTPMETTVLTATQDGDFEVRELAFGILSARKHPEPARLAEEQLLDVDPAVRLLGLRHLTAPGIPQTMPTVMPLLDDPDERVLSGAIGALRQFADKDFATQLAPPSYDYDLANEAAPAAKAALRQEAEQLKARWAAQQGNYPNPRTAPPPLAWRLPAHDFSLADVWNKKFRLADFKGKIVLAHFFDPKLPTCLEQLSALNKLQQQSAGRLAVLGIWVVTGEHANCHCGEDPDHATAEEKEHAEALAQSRTALQEIILARGLNFPLLVDPHATVIHRFEGRTPPVGILIDPQGNIRRRFIGTRELDALERMVNELDNSRETPPTKQ